MPYQMTGNGEDGAFVLDTETGDIWSVFVGYVKTPVTERDRYEPRIVHFGSVRDSKPEALTDVDA